MRRKRKEGEKEKWFEEGRASRLLNSKKKQKRRHEEGRKNCPMVQIFVKADGSKVFPLDVSLSHKVCDIVFAASRHARATANRKCT